MDQLRGVDDALIAARVHDVQLYPGGNWFSSAGVQEGESETDETLVEAVLGEGVALTGFDAAVWQDALGKS